ncbi:hypothetical protein AYP97_01755 [Lactobacillus crispatus]|uniref:hypothetical protein n=1 Tax=Lactobacillus TaxID=1578 RepID=UPI000B5DA1D8|nr:MULTISPECIES: hypothetical protein [Lactobacillus]OXC46634.1 hypothetical protein AYP97_01755 [Lactobacillus crispatus]OXC48359.1 hypothetical protein AYP98_02245 [Lactobacillus crispatus]OXC49362.1 hypothetical protein AYP96_04640 [Lactobacillus crispatus]OXC53008.1 hypothetical protein AYQ01_01505 [Lactobacillus crispatus]OXC54280.1 hypothetical protein AYP99_05395 [Lactobacillus crispatus]
MFKNKFIKLLTAATFAVVGISSINTMSHVSTVQASAFHYLRKDHKFVTLGLGQNLPVREYSHGKLIQKDDPSNEDTYCDFNVLKTHGWKYINGQKYYNVPNQKTLDATSAYINAKYFTKKYNDLSYEQIYTVIKDFSPRNGDMQASKTNLTLTKGANIEVDMYSKDDDIVSMSSPIDAKHGLKGLVDDGSYKDSFWLKMTQSQFRNNCRKAAPNAKFVFNEDGDYETNASLARGGIYHKGHFYKVYTR